MDFIRKKAPLVLSLALALLTLTIIITSEAAPIKDPLKIESGLISGFSVGEQEKVLIFKGIPYAKPPLGELRWKPPQPADPWAGVRQTREPGARCPQPPSPVFTQQTWPQSEDCLYLNVWTAARDTEEKRPVMFWIHGGGSTTGSGGDLIYSGAQLANLGVVVVTINYRLGPLGFMAHPLLSKESGKGVSGNYGFLDQIEALKWVKKNIKAFGGDPDRVTIFGESAGAAAVTRLMVSPLARGLFHRVISESGGPFGRNRRLKEDIPNLESAEKVGVKIADQFGVSQSNDVLKALRAKTPEETIRVSKPVPGLFGQGIKFGPIVDGWALPEDPESAWIGGKIADVPFLVGANADEGTIFLPGLPINDVKGYEDWIKLTIPERPQEILRLFPARTNEEVKPALNKLIGVSAFIAPARTMARLASKGSSKVFLYHFNRVAPLPALQRLGSFHAAEIAYAFGNLGPVLSKEPIDGGLSDKMKRYWTNFARNGDPNGPGLPVWLAYQKERDQHLELGAEIKVGSGLYQEACDIFEERLYKNIRK
ncbi:MAG: carboxylesterase family protein [Deltaproteobacteria bacterium]|nr:carboxylesterase family protein [Deltaproteobacteria bacterium]